MTDISKVAFDKNPKSMSEADLASSHSLLHEAWKTRQEEGSVRVEGEPRSNEDLINYHALLIQEMKDRGLEHESEDGFDEVTSPFVKHEDEIELILDGDCFEKGIQPFGSPAGKSKVAKRLIEMIPNHKRYIEPFCGAAAVFFAKDRVDTEILSDNDPEIIAALRFVQTMKPAELTRLKRFNWTSSKKTFEKIKERAPQDRLERFYRFKYLQRYSFSSNRHGYAPSREGESWSGFERLVKASERLKDVELICGDGCTVMARRSTDDSFTFIDPPYWNVRLDYGEHDQRSEDFDSIRFKESVKLVKGRWMITLMSEAHEINARWKRRIVFQHQSPSGVKHGGGAAKRAEWMLSNYNTQNVNSSSEMSIEKQLEVPEEGPKYGYVMQHHRRGKSNHLDFRLESVDKESLIGWTIADAIADLEKTSVDEEARSTLDLPPEEEMTANQKDRWIRKMFVIAQQRDGERKNFKIDWQTGRFQMRETEAGAVVPAQLRSFGKGRSPKAWLKVEGVTAPFPAPGATKEFRGVFTIIDGTKAHGGGAWVEYGRQAPEFREYFLFGGTMKGRLVFRQLSRDALAKNVIFLDGDHGECFEVDKQLITLPPGMEEEGDTEDMIWTAIQPIDQTPQYLSKRAVDSGDMPPVGKSGLPAVVKSKIPSKFRYWEEKTASAAKNIRNELVKSIQDNEIELDFNKLLGVPETEKVPS